MRDIHIVISNFIIILQRSHCPHFTVDERDSQILNKSFNVSKLKCEPRSISPQITVVELHTRFGGYF